MGVEMCEYNGKRDVCCFEGEPYEGSENLQFKSVIENYDDYLNNKRFLERKTQECNNRHSLYRKQERANMEMLKNLFLSEFISSEKQIKGLCIHETKFIKDPFYQNYLYIVNACMDGILEGGLYISGVRICFHEENGDLTNITIQQEKSYPISYETLCSCRITEQEFMDVYNRANNKIMEQLGLNKVESK